MQFFQRSTGDLNSLIKITFLSFIFLFPLRIFAERLPVKIYTSADGLGSGFVDNLMKDSRGFMWFGTRDGLSRFDGARFVTYRIGEKDSPPGIEHIYESKSGIYWIATTRGTYRFNPNDPDQIDISTANLKAEFITPDRGELYEDSKGNFWSTSPTLSTIQDKNGKIEFVPYDLNLPPELAAGLAVQNVTESIDGSIWLNSNKGFFRLLPDKRVVYYPVEKTASIGNFFLMADRKGYIWISYGTNFLVMKPEPVEYFADAPLLLITKPIEPISKVEIKPETSYPMPEKPGEIIQFVSSGNERFIEKSFSKKMLETSDGVVWVSAENNLLEFSDGIFHLHSDNEGLPTVMWRMAEDSAGNLWIASYSGLARLDRHGMTSYGAKDGANSSRFYTINEDNQGTLYFSALDFYQNLFKQKKLLPVRPKIPLESISAWTSRPALLDSNSNWWFLTNNKLFYFSGISDFAELASKSPTKIYSTADGLKSNSIFQIFEDSKGNIWISTNGSSNAELSISRLNNGEDKFHTFTAAEGLPDGSFFSSATEDSAGNIWFSFYRGGIARFDGEKFEVWGENHGVLKGAALDLFADKQGRLWIASSVEGLYRIDDSTAKTPAFVRLTTADGLSSNNIRTITGDDHGRIYLGSARGVDCLSPDTGFVKHYSVNDGLAADFIVDSHKDKNGNLWFVTNSGVSKLTPQAEEKTFAPKILIGSLWIAGEQQPVSKIGSLDVDKGELSANRNNLQINFFGLDFRAGEDLRYQYKLEGTDENWSLPTEQRSVNYANLSPGNYRFLVRAVNSDGKVSENPAVVTFKILQPLYFRWWFIALAVLTLGAGIFALDRYRVRKTHQVETALDETKRANLLIQESETRFRTLADTASDAILTIDTQSNIVFINQAIEKVFGYSAEELIGKPMTVLMPERMREGHNSGITRYLSTSKKHINWAGVALIGLHKDGHEIPLEVSFGEFDLDGERYFTGIARDVSERKKAEEALQKSREERFKELQLVRTRIATDLHDDIGSSLSQISLYSELARQRERESGKAGEQLDMITNVANDLVNEMSDIVWAINPKKDHLQDLTQRMRRFAANVLTAKDIDLEFNSPDSEQEIPLGANIRREVFLIFKETVNNIAKHSEATETKIDFLMQNSELIINFEDNGKGFNQDEKLSENGHQDWKKFRGGNGLLNMRKRAAELGGSYAIKSEIDKGTSVILTVPLEIIVETIVTE